MGAPWRDESTLRRLFHEECLKTGQVADRLGVTPWTIRKWTDRFDIDRQHNQPYQDGDKLRRLYHGEQLSAAEIADQFDVSPSTIHRWLDYHDIEQRTSGEHQTPLKLRDPDWIYRQHYDNDKTAREMADEIGCSEDAVYRAFNRHEVENRRTTNLPLGAKAVLTDPDELDRLYHDEFKSQNELADMLGVDQGTVSRWLDRHDIDSHSRSDYSGERHPRYNPEASPHVYDTQWRKARETVIERDGSECQKCGISREEHIDGQEMDLDVHHITPQHEVDDKYDTENLITMCRSCHIEVEQSNEGAIHIQGGV